MKVAIVDYESVDSLKSALSGIDAVVATVGSLSVTSQKLLLDAAIAAKVPRFIPSEFGSDLHSPKTRQLPVFKTKVEFEDYLSEKAKAGEITYTIIMNGAFFDWGIKNQFLCDLENNSIEFYDGGDIAYSATTLPTIAKAVVGTLKNLEATKNKAFYIQDTAISPKKLLSFLKKHTPGVEWKVEQRNTEEMEKKSYAQLAAGDFSDPFLWSAFVRTAMFGPGYGGNFKNLSNDLFGIKEMTDAEIDAMVKQAVEEGSKTSAAL